MSRQMDEPKSYHRFVFWSAIVVIALNAVLLAVLAAAGLYWLATPCAITIAFLSTVAGSAHEKWVCGDA